MEMAVAMTCEGESLVSIQTALVPQAVMLMAPVKCYMLGMEVIAKVKPWFRCQIRFDRLPDLPGELGGQGAIRAVITALGTALAEAVTA